MQIDEQNDSEAIAAPMSPARFWSALALGGLALAVLIGLGVWQVERLYWKQSVLQMIESRINGPVSTLPQIIEAEAENADVDYRPVEISGRFDHSGERYFLSTLKGEAGWNVYTPLLVENAPYAVFVNRGFVPYEMQLPETRVMGQVPGVVTIEGLVRSGQTEQPEGFFMPENDPQEHVFYWRNIPQMAEGLNLPAGVVMLPFVVDASESAVPGGYPIGGQTIVTLPNNHLQYAITWFGIAAGLAILLIIMVVTQRRRSRMLGEPARASRPELPPSDERSEMRSEGL